jgi:hypothetical protein
VPVAAGGGELRLDLLLVLGQRRGAGPQALLLEHLDEDGHADVHRVDAERRGELEHLHDLLGGGAQPQRGRDVLPDAGQVHVRGVGVDRDVDKLLDLVVEVVLPPRDGGEPQVAGDELRVEPQGGLPGLAPGPADLDELVLDLLLALRQ